MTSTFFYFYFLSRNLIKIRGAYYSVEKGKISYFGLARNLIRYLISPNQDDLSNSARTFISAHQIL